METQQTKLDSWVISRGTGDITMENIFYSKIHDKVLVDIINDCDFGTGYSVEMNIFESIKQTTDEFLRDFKR